MDLVGLVGVDGGCLAGVDGGCLGGSTATVPLPVPLCCLVSSGLVSFFSSFFSVRRVLEEVVPVDAFLGLVTGRAWVEGVSVCLGGSTTRGPLSTVLGSFTGTTKSGAFGMEGVG